MSGIPYPPPTENLPIFDDSVFNVISATGQTSNILSTNNTFTGVNTFTQNIVGNITGTSSSTSAVTLTIDNTTGSYYVPFSKTATATNALFIDNTTTPLTYNPATSNLTATTFTGLCSTSGLVFLQTLTGTITGAATATTFTLPAIFNTTYKNYKIQFTFGENNFTAYPSISLNAFTGANPPLSADIYGYDLTSGALTAVSLANQTLSTTPIQMTGAALSNIQLEFDVFNVGYTTAFSANIVRIVCNSVYNNPGVKGVRNITVQLSQNSSSTITGLSLQTIMGLGNNPTWTAKIYGYK